MSLSPALAKLFGAEAADPVQPETENHAVLFSESDVEARKLPRHRTAVPGVPEGHGRADQRAVASSRPLLEVEQEGSSAKNAPPPITQESRRAPLRSTHGPRLEPARIGKLREVRRKLDGPRVVK